MKFASLPIGMVICVAAFSAADARQVLVEGHYRPNGTWVPPHYRTVPDSAPYEGPAYVNPYTGATAGYPYQAPYPSPYAAPYQAPYQAPYAVPYQRPYEAPVPPAPYYGAP